MTERYRIYTEYIGSSVWRAIRREVIIRDGCCLKCKSTKRLVVHHLSYPDVLGEEDLDTLQTLCEDCHNILHGGSPRKVKNQPKIKNKKKKLPRTPKKVLYLSGAVRSYTKEEIAEYESNRRLALLSPK